MRYDTDRFPDDGDLCTVCPPAQHKSAALFFNRIFVPVGEFDYIDTPQQITFGYDFGSDHPDWELWMRFGLNVFAYTDRGMLGFDRYVTSRYANQGITVVPGYGSARSFNSVFGDSGETLAYHAVLANLPVISESVEWDQIMEFRNDRGSYAKSRRLRNWLREGIHASSPSEAADIVSQMIDDYATAIRKHGMKTVAGGLTLFIAAFSAGVTAAAGGVIGAIVAGMGVATGAIAWLIKQECDLDDIERGKDSEIAIIYDAIQRFG